MRKSIKTLLMAGVLVLSLLTRNKVYAETILGDFLKERDAEIEVSATLDYYNKYVWRGFLLDDDSVLQPGVTISGYGFEGGFWGSWDLESNDALNSDETDGWIGYGFNLGFIDEALSIVGLSIGHTWYGFPEADFYSKELYLGVSLDTFLAPYFTWYHDYEDEAHGGADGDYYIFGVGHSISLNDTYGLTLDLGQELCYNSGAFINGEGGYSLTTLGFTIPLTEQLTMSPNIGYSLPLGDMAHELDSNQKEQLYGGVSLAFSF